MFAQMVCILKMNTLSSINYICDLWNNVLVRMLIDLSDCNCVMLKVTTAQVNFVNFTTVYNETHTTVWCFFYSYLCNETPLWYLCFTHRTVGSFSSKLLLFYIKCPRPSWLNILNSFLPPCIILSELNKWTNFTMQNKMKVKQHVYK